MGQKRQFFLTLLLLLPFLLRFLIIDNNQEYSVEFSSYFNVMWTEPRLHIPDRFKIILIFNHHQYHLDATTRRNITYSWREGENIVHLQQLVSPCLLPKLKTKFPINIKLVIFRFLHELNESDNAGLIQSIWHWCKNFFLKMLMVDLCAMPGL